MLQNTQRNLTAWSWKTGLFSWSLSITRADLTSVPTLQILWDISCVFYIFHVRLCISRHCLFLPSRTEDVSTTTGYFRHSDWMQLWGFRHQLALSRMLGEIGNQSRRLTALLCNTYKHSTNLGSLSSCFHFQRRNISHCIHLIPTCMLVFITLHVPYQ